MHDEVAQRSAGQVNGGVPSPCRACDITLKSQWNHRVATGATVDRASFVLCAAAGPSAGDLR